MNGEPDKIAPEPDGTVLKPEELNQPSSPAPADPRPFQLRGDAPRVVRLSTKALAVVGGIAGLGIGGALIYALLPSADRTSEELFNIENRS